MLKLNLYDKFIELHHPTNFETFINIFVSTLNNMMKKKNLKFKQVKNQSETQLL